MGALNRAKIELTPPRRRRGDDGRWGRSNVERNSENERDF